jgi:hypothetical protein
MSVFIHRRRRHGAKVRTDRSGACIDTVLNELLAHRLQVDDDLPRLDLVHGTALYGLDRGHVIPCRRCVRSIEWQVTSCDMSHMTLPADATRSRWGTLEIPLPLLTRNPEFDTHELF